MTFAWKSLRYPPICLAISQPCLSDGQQTNLRLDSGALGPPGGCSALQSPNMTTIRVRKWQWSQYTPIMFPLHPFEFGSTSHDVVESHDSPWNRINNKKRRTTNRSQELHIKSHPVTINSGKSSLAGGVNPSEKYDFVSWDDEIPKYFWKNNNTCSKPPTINHITRDNIPSIINHH